jgi:hypothetical protein
MSPIFGMILVVVVAKIWHKLRPLSPEEQRKLDRLDEARRYRNYTDY